MSKANSPIKVLRVALKRVNKRWGKQAWSKKESGIWLVCLEGAITGGCQIPQTDAQREALEVIRAVLREREKGINIPEFNDSADTELDDVIEVIKLGIIKLETNWELEPEELDSIIEQL